MSNQWYSIVEYAREFNISDMTIRRRIKNGKLNAVLRDGKYYIPVTSSEAKRLKAHPIVEDFEDFEQSPTPPSPRSNSKNSIVQTRYIAPEHNSRPNANTKTRSMERYSQNEDDFDRSEIMAPIIEKKKSSGSNHRSYHVGKHIPSQLLDGFATNETSLIQTNALLDFCEHSMEMVHKMEMKIQEQSENSIKALKAELETKNLEIKSLQQQVEDLQVLVKILERRNA